MSMEKINPLLVTKSEDPESDKLRNELEPLCQEVLKVLDKHLDPKMNNNKIYKCFYKFIYVLNGLEDIDQREVKNSINNKPKKNFFIVKEEFHQEYIEESIDYFQKLNSRSITLQPYKVLKEENKRKDKELQND